MDWLGSMISQRNWLGLAWVNDFSTNCAWMCLEWLGKAQITCPEQNENKNIRADSNERITPQMKPTMGPPSKLAPRLWGDPFLRAISSGYIRADSFNVERKDYSAGETYDGPTQNVTCRTLD